MILYLDFSSFSIRKKNMRNIYKKASPVCRPIKYAPPHSDRLITSSVRCKGSMIPSLAWPSFVFLIFRRVSRPVTLCRTSFSSQFSVPAAYPCLPSVTTSSFASLQCAPVWLYLPSGAALLSVFASTHVIYCDRPSTAALSEIYTDARCAFLPFRHSIRTSSIKSRSIKHYFANFAYLV